MQLSHDPTDLKPANSCNVQPEAPRNTKTQGNAQMQLEQQNFVPFEQRTHQDAVEQAVQDSAEHTACECRGLAQELFDLGEQGAQCAGNVAKRKVHR